MADQYHYDKEGKYQGKTSDTPPSSGDGCGAIILIFIIIALVSKCSGSSSRSSSTEAPAAQTYSAPVENNAPAPQPYEPPAEANGAESDQEFEFK